MNDHKHCILNKGNQFTQYCVFLGSHISLGKIGGGSLAQLFLGPGFCWEPGRWAAGGALQRLQPGHNQGGAAPEMEAAGARLSFTPA